MQNYHDIHYHIHNVIYLLESGQSTNASSTRSSVGNTVIAIAEDSVFSTDHLDPNYSIQQSLSKSPSLSFSPYKTSSAGSIKSNDARRDTEFQIQISRNKTVVRETTLVFEKHRFALRTLANSQS